jgi:hypothetical protein
MSNKTDPKEPDYYIDWLNKSIKEEHIIYYEYSDFKNFQLIGSGSYGKVKRANWKDNQFYALKSFNNDLKKAINEVQHLQLFKGSI